MRLHCTAQAALLLLVCWAAAAGEQVKLQKKKTQQVAPSAVSATTTATTAAATVPEDQDDDPEEDSQESDVEVQQFMSKDKQEIVNSLKETLRRLMPPSEAFDSAESTEDGNQQQKVKKDGDDEVLEKLLTDSWVQTMTEHLKLVNGADIMSNSVEEEEVEDWNEEKLEDLPPEEPPEPLTPQEQEAEELFVKAKELLKKTRSNKREAYKLLAAAATLGHKEARSAQAWFRLLGTNIYPDGRSTQDIPAAVQTFKELVETGLPSAHMGMGFLYATGLGGVNASQAKALLHYKMAALGGDIRAQMIMGYRYWAGISVPTSCEKALDFYRKVATKVAQSVSLSGGPVVHRIRLLDEHESPNYSNGIFDQDLLEYYQLLAEKGDQQAQVGLGQLHYQGGRGVPIDHERAVQYFESAANSGSASAQAFLGRIYLEGSDVIKQDNATALKYFEAAAQQNNPMGLSGLGLMYLHGRGVERDPAKAFHYFSKAADQGWVDGQLQLGNMYFSGTGVKRDFAIANKYFNLASQSGHVLAFYNLAQMHATGTGVMPSCTTAVDLLKIVAERGKYSEHLMAAHSDYREGRIDEAFVVYYLLAEMGYEVAQSNAAFILDRAETTILNEEEGLVRALALWGRAAAQGYSAAQVKLGDAHYYGRGTKVDYEAAASHYHAASEQQHNAQAMFNLGYMHERGLGLKKDRHLAKRRYDEAAEANVDARIPVALALIKLYILFGLDYLQETALFRELSQLDESLIESWDLFLISIFSGLLLSILLFRRPQLLQQQQQRAQRPAAAPVN